MGLFNRKPRALFPCPECGFGYLLPTSAKLCEITHDIKKTLEAE